MVILETQSTQPEEGCFFNGIIDLEDGDQTDRRWQYYCRDFWLAHSDIIGNDGTDPAVLVQYGFDSQGIAVDADDANRQGFVNTVKFLYDQEQDVYKWNITKPDEDGRTSYTLLTNTVYSQAVICRYNRQGKKVNQADASYRQVTKLINEFTYLTSSGLFKKQVEKLRQRQESLGIDIANFSIAGLKKYGNEKYQEILEKKQEALSRAVFSPLNFSD
jgi:hypothetical protein